jgi:uncharacterized protein YlxW (UPF0749 family)
MTLLREVMERPLDPGYATAAARRAQGVTRSRRALALTLALAIVCGAVTARSIAELRRPQPGAAEARAALQGELRRRSAAADAQQRQLDQLRAQVAALQARTLTSRGSSELAGQAGLLGLLSAETSVAGPGLTVTLADSPTATASAGSTDPRAAADGQQGRVLDHDMQIVVNGLWAAGAEAIAINGQRLTARTAIRYAGQAILVDFRPLVPPYVISALGDPAPLQTRFAAGSGGAYLQALRDNYGIRAAIVSSANLELPGASGFSTRVAYARTVSSPASASASSPTPPGSPEPRGSTSPGASPASSASSPSTAAPTPEVSP